MNKILRLTLLLTVVAVLALAGAGCTSKMKKAYHESRADKFFAAGNFDSAEIEYLRVLRDDNENAKAFARLSGIYFDQGRYQLAAPFLERAVALATNDMDLRVRLCRILSASGRIKETRDLAGFILDRDPQSAEAPLLLAQSVSTPKDVAEIRARLEKLAKAGDRPAYAVALGVLSLREGDLKNAEALFRKALALDPKSADAMVSLAALQAMQKDLKAAEANFKAAADLSPARSTRRLLYARFKLQVGERDAARQILEAVVKEAPDYIPALIGLGEIALDEKKYDDCRAALDKVLARDPDNFDGDMLASRLKYAQQDLIGCVAVLERMSKVFPQSSGVHFQLGAAYYAGGDESKAIVSLNRALELDANLPSALLLLAEIQVRNRNPDPAMVSLAKFTPNQPEYVAAQLLLADAYRQRGREREALAIYLALEKTAPKNAQIPLLTGAAFMQFNDPVSARKAYERALMLAPDSLPTLEQMVNLDLTEKKYTDAMRRVQTRLQVVPNEIQLQLLVAKVQIAQDDRTAAEATLLKIAEANPKSETPGLLLAQLYFDAKQVDKAKQQLSLAIDRNPRNIPAMMLLATMRENDKDYKGAAETYDRVLAANPKFSPALNNLAYVCSEYLGQLDRAYELAQSARELLPFDPAAADTLGWVLYKRGAYASALGLLQESATKLPDQAEIIFHLGMAQYMTGDEAGARVTFQKAMSGGKEFRGRSDCQSALELLEINPQTADAAARAKLEKRIAEKFDDPVAQGRFAIICERDGDLAKAIAAYEAVLKTDAKNLSALNGLSRLWETKDIAKAYGYAKAAYKIAPSDTTSAHLYGRLAYQSGDLKLADSVLQPAAKSAPENSRLQFDYARATYLVGKTSVAQAALQTAQSGNLPAGLALEAANMSELIAFAVNPEATSPVVTKISELLKADPNYVPALMALAKVKELTGDLPGAVAACEKILTRAADFSPAQRELAILLSNDKAKVQSAYALAVKARDSYPNDPTLAKAIGVIVFNQGDFSRAASLLKDCAAKQANDAEIFYYLGAAQAKLKQNLNARQNLQQALVLKLSGSLADSAKQLLAGLK
jgi:tetratricopeptide (TPR) repeat protein